MSIFNLRNVLLAISATVTMDVLSIAGIKLRPITPLPPHLIGRWFASVARGQVLHDDIGRVSPINTKWRSPRLCTMRSASPWHDSMSLCSLRLRSTPMLEDHLLVRCLRKAFRMFPEGCSCEDSLDCRFCRCVVAVALRIAHERTGDRLRTEEPRYEGSTFIIPVSEDAQVYELRRLFRRARAW